LISFSPVLNDFLLALARTFVARRLRSRAKADRPFGDRRRHTLGQQPIEDLALSTRTLSTRKSATP
jgi:hypothetical protein